MKAIDLTGQTFGKLTVVSRIPVKTRARQALWLARCKCGAEVKILGGNLRRGTKSCKSCAGRRYTHINRGSVAQMRRRGWSWQKIAEHFGSNSNTMRANFKTRRNEDASWVARHYKQVTAMVDAGHSFEDIRRTTGYRNNYAMLEKLWLGYHKRRIERQLQMWVQSPHGRVVRTLHEGHTPSRGALRANVGGSEWRRLSTKALPPYAAWMLSMPLEKIAAWHQRGATWREINEFLDKPFRFGAVTDVCFHARRDWDAALEKKIVEDF